LGVDEKYVWRPFTNDDVLNDTLKAARQRKMNKYVDIITDAKSWLERNKEEISIKYKVSSIEVEYSYIIISNFGVVPRSTG
jgi:myosin-crossreactive antigen